MSIEAMDDARRQIEICNACRYCEGYCAVFPAITRDREFSPATIEHLANVCHNCRACYYACQFAEPHEFAVNIPRTLAEIRQKSWQDHIPFGSFAKFFARHGAAIAFAVLAGFAGFIWAVRSLQFAGGGDGFYAWLSHSAMVAVFVPAFLAPLVIVAIGVARYWRHTGGGLPTLGDFADAFGSAARLKNLAGGHGDGCNFEDEDRFSNARRWFHQATMYGFLLCFAATSVATLMHYVLAVPAPYGLLSPPKLLGVPGGVLLCAGTAGLAWLKLKADRKLGDEAVFGGEMGFVLLLFAVSATGLALWLLGKSAWLPELLALHLGAVLAFFLLTPFTKMVHGFFRLAALVQEARLRRTRPSLD